MLPILLGSRHAKMSLTWQDKAVLWEEQSVLETHVMLWTPREQCWGDWVLQVLPGSSSDSTGSSLLFLKVVKVKVAQLCPTLCKPVDCSPWNSPGQNTGAVAFPLSRGLLLLSICITHSSILPEEEPGRRGRRVGDAQRVRRRFRGAEPACGRVGWGGRKGRGTWDAGELDSVLGCWSSGRVILQRGPCVFTWAGIYFWSKISASKTSSSRLTINPCVATISHPIKVLKVCLVCVFPNPHSFPHLPGPHLRVPTESSPVAPAWSTWSSKSGGMHATSNATSTTETWWISSTCSRTRGWNCPGAGRSKRTSRERWAWLLLGPYIRRPMSRWRGRLMRRSKSVPETHYLLATRWKGG